MGFLSLIVTIFLEEYLEHCGGDIVTKTCRESCLWHVFACKAMFMSAEISVLASPHYTKQFKLAGENTTPDISGKESARALSACLVEAGNDRKRSARTRRHHYAFIEHEKASF
jgi:hypothetical protein